VREALFSILGPLDGLRVLDLYAGSGALGIEALSRGAREATFVDSDAAAARAMRENLERVGSDRGRVFRADALSFLRGAARHRESWDLVLCDPPYTLAPRLGSTLGPLLYPVLAPDARIVCESSPKHPLRLDLPVNVERRYGDTLIVLYCAPGRSS
jgi:16S rRNA (guanine966-N2)-methyltransferase